MIWASVIAGSAAVIAAALGAYNARNISRAQVKLQEVHVLVNNRLDTALDQIEDLKTQRNQLHDEAAEAKDEPNHS